eukprot:g3778.t1
MNEVEIENPFVDAFLDFFQLAVHQILFQREVYPKRLFRRHQHFGLQVRKSANEELNDYISTTGKNFRTFLCEDKVRQIVIILTKSKKICEKYVFEINHDALQEMTVENNVGPRNVSSGANVANHRSSFRKLANITDPVLQTKAMDWLQMGFKRALTRLMLTDESLLGPVIQGCEFQILLSIKEQPMKFLNSPTWIHSDESCSKIDGRNGKKMVPVETFGTNVDGDPSTGIQIQLFCEVKR